MEVVNAAGVQWHSGRRQGQGVAAWVYMVYILLAFAHHHLAPKVIGVVSWRSVENGRKGASALWTRELGGAAVMMKRAWLPYRCGVGSAPAALWGHSLQGAVKRALQTL